MLGALLLGEPDARGRDHLLQKNNNGANLGLRAGDWKLVQKQGMITPQNCHGGARRSEAGAAKVPGVCI